MSDQEDLDFHIMFPSFPPSSKDPTLTTGDQDHHEEFVFVYEEDKRPIVILLGWAGCQDKYLAKYSAIYEEKSCITLRYTAPVECLFWRRDKMPFVGKRLIQVILEKKLEQHPIFFHIFSNGGAFLYQHVSLAMQEANTQFQVKGAIFDSAPGERRMTTLFKAISAIIGGHPITNIPITFFITVFLSFLWLFEVVAHAFGRGYPVTTNPYTLAEEAQSWPQLFLYSNADNLIPAALGQLTESGTRAAPRGKEMGEPADRESNSCCSWRGRSFIPLEINFSSSYVAPLSRNVFVKERDNGTCLSSLSYSFILDSDVTWKF